MTREMSSIILCAFGALAFFVIRGQLDSDIVSLNPDISYKAEVSLQINDEMINGTVRHVPGSTRSEYEFNGLSIVEIERWKEDRTYLILPELRQFVRVPQRERKRAVGQLNSVINRFVHSIRKVGSEQHDRLHVTKYEFIDKKVTVNFWVSNDGLLVRMTIAGEYEGRSMNIEYELSNIAVGPQEAANFRIPPGYTQVPSVNHFRR